MRKFSLISISAVACWSNASAESLDMLDGSIATIATQPANAQNWIIVDASPEIPVLRLWTSEPIAISMNERGGGAVAIQNINTIKSWKPAQQILRANSQNIVASKMSNGSVCSAINTIGTSC